MLVTPRLILAIVALLLLRPAVSGAQNVVFQNGTPFTTSGLTGFSTRGMDMVGMQVTATFADGTVRTGVWSQFGSSVFFGISDPGFYELRMDGTQVTASYTVASLWRILGLSTTTQLVKVQMNGALGRTLFDCNFRDGACQRTVGFDPGIIGTAGSSTGSEIGFWDSYNLTEFNASHLTATYANVVGIGGASPVGDLFEQLTLDFKGLGANQFFRFDLDTDSSQPNAAPPAPAVPTTSVPEPSTVVLMSVGLLALVGARRVRRREVDGSRI